MLHYDVKTMTCAHCVRAVTEAVHSVDPAARVEVDLASGGVGVETAAVDADEKIRSAIAEAGYEATRRSGA